MFAIWSSTSICTSSGVLWERRCLCWIWWLNDFVGGANDDISRKWLVAICKRILWVSFSQLPICQWLTPATQLNDPKYLYRRRAMVCAQAVVRKLPTATTHLARSRSTRSTASCHLWGTANDVCWLLNEKIWKNDFHKSDSFETTSSNAIQPVNQFVSGQPRRRCWTTQNTSAGGEQWCVRKQLCASCAQQRIWRAAARCVRQRFVIFWGFANDVLRLTFLSN